MTVKTLALACMAAAGLVLGTAQAQTPPAAKPAAKPAAAAQTAAKPAAKPAAPAEGGKTASLPGGTGLGPILSRDELRACLSQEESIRKRLDELGARSGPLNKEKEALAAEQAALRADSAPMEELKKAADELNGRTKDYGVRVEALNQKVTDFNTTPPKGLAAERVRSAIGKEREELDKLRVTLEAERVALNARSEETVRSYTARAGALDAKVADWNQRNNARNDAARAAEEERQAWLTACADRRYREDDEIAIRRGK